jgi:glycosyltransferase involved in cell wall biosynthesis
MAPSNNMTKRICFIGLQNLPVLAREFNRHGIGGEEVQHTLLAKALAARGYDVSMVVADYGQPDGAEWGGIKTYKAYKPSVGWPGVRFFWPRWVGMWSALKRANADVYYISCAGFRVGLCALFTRQYHRKLIFRIASDMDCEPHKLLIEYRYNYSRDKVLYEFGLRRADAILAQSISQQAALERNYGLRSRVAPMMVDRAQMDLSFDERSVTVLWVSNIRQLKRPDLLLELAAGLPDLGVHMIGGQIATSAALYGEVRQKAAAVPNITFHGQIPYHDVNDFFERARVFVNTSDIEGFPNSYLQAWARGTPIVAFFDPDHLITREGLGRAVSSMEEMKIAVRELTADAELWRAASARCKAFMARQFNESRILETYVDVIDSPSGRERGL